MTNSIATQLQNVRIEIQQRANKVQRQNSEIELVAVSKKKTAQDIRMAYAAGQRHFAENYIQEFLRKKDELSDLNIVWHFVGHIQKNKVKKMIGQADMIQTLDRLSLAETFNFHCESQSLIQNCLVQVNLSQEESKHGCAPTDLFKFVATLNDLSSLNIKGLMMIGTHTDDVIQTRSEFKVLKQLRDKLNALKIYKEPLTELSMGMSGDYKEAVEEGATLVRIGSKIFGERN